MVTLNELLASRDARHAMQQQLLADHSGKTLVCLTVVVPGSVKRNHQSLVVAHAAVDAIREAFAPEEGCLIERDLPTGYEAYLITPMPLLDAKLTATRIEDTHPLGRLFDIDIIDENGCLTEDAQILVGEDRFVAREKIVKMLEEAGNIEIIEDYISPVGYSERTNAVIEPKLSAQWFLKMEELAPAALARVEEGEIKFIPDKYRNTYRHWMENARDWCISRQLWWGQRIPAYYLPDGRYVVESTAEKALEAAKLLDPNITAADLHQDEDVLDTWFSSWLWPISVFDPKRPGVPEHKPNADLSYYYPTNDLVTGPDIIFFWVARMIMAGDEFMDEVPFRNVYFTGIVRDKLGRKMSKTLGNSPNPLDLIEKYGADAVRLGMLLCSSAGSDILYDESQVEQGRNFCGKIWNAYRLISSWSVDEKAEQSENCRTAVKWFDNLLSKTIEQVEDHYAKFRISDALMTIYKLFWDQFCAWYLELVKPAFGQPIDGRTYESTMEFFEKLLKMIHPIMPFITEELWQTIAERREGQTIMFERTPVAGPYDEDFLSGFEKIQEAIVNIRGIRAQKQISPKESLKLYIDGEIALEFIPILQKSANLSEIISGEYTGTAVSFIVGTIKMSVALDGFVNADEEKAKILAELEHQRGFLESVNKKLSNPSFVDHAPEKVVAMERKKQADATARIEALEATLKTL